MRLNKASAISNGAIGAGKLKRRDHDFVALRNTFRAELGPFFERVDLAGIFAGEIDARLSAEAESGDGGIEAWVAHAVAEHGHENVAGFDQAISGDEVAVGLNVGDMASVGGSVVVAMSGPDFAGAGDMRHRRWAGDEGLERAAWLVGVGDGAIAAGF